MAPGTARVPQPRQQALWVALFVAALAEKPGGGAASCAESEACSPERAQQQSRGSSLLTLQTRHRNQVSKAHPEEQEKVNALVTDVHAGLATTRAACVPLTGHGSHFTVDVEVGTPGQKLSVVADTGSNTLIVQSCLCGQVGNCETAEETKCFQGPGNSTSYSLLRLKGSEKTLQLRVSFGSGDVVGIVATDVVRVASIATEMDGGFLLMTEQALKLQGPTLEGILGLGIPQSARAGPPSTAIPSGEILPGFRDVHGFLEQAAIKRFSMCFSSLEQGVLRLGSPEKSNLWLSSVGKQHWGLSIEGFSVASTGVSTDLVSLCSRSSMKEGQETPCGAIPDSGSTGIFGPESHLAAVKASLCKAWPRCKSAAEEEKAMYDKGRVDPYTEAELAETLAHAATFEKVIRDCGSWLGNASGAQAEVPALRFRLRGAAGEEQTLEIPGKALLFTTEQEEVKEETIDLGVFGKYPIGTVKTGKKKLVCESVFSPQEFNTELNGPVWILGLPLFYEYVVHYSLGTVPPSMSFVSVAEEACRTCGGTDEEIRLTDIGGSEWEPHPVGRWRRPSIDPQQPL